MFKKGLIIASFVLFFTTGQVFAVSPAPPAPAPPVDPWKDCLSGPNQDVATLACIPVVLNNLISFLALFAGVVAVFLLMYAGLKFITSEGDPQKVAGARRTLVFVLWGAIIVVASFLIIALISRITGANANPVFKYIAP